MKMPGGARRHKQRPPELMMTPMIDIVFNLIIFFILTPSFKAEEGYLPTNLPGPGQAQRAEVKKTDSYQIVLDNPDQDGEEVNIFLGGEQMRDFAELRARLKAATANLNDEMRKEASVIIEPATTTWQKHVVAAFDAAVAAGLSNINFVVPK